MRSSIHYAMGLRGAVTMNVVAYIRVSTDEQAEKGNSLLEQRERLTAYCIAMGWSEPVFYEDDGFSAKDLRRPALTQMLNDIKNRKFNRLITTKLDRLSRKLLDVLNTIDFLDKYDCQFISSSESFDTSTPSGRLTLQLLGSFGEFERERNSERVKDNMRSLARQGEKVISRPCYGYNIVNGIREINIEESLNLRMMAEWAAAGEGARSIAKRVNAMGIKTKQNNLWHEKIIRELLQRETLIGRTVYNQTYKKDGKTITRPEEEWIRNFDQHDPILDEELFFKIGELFDARKTIGKFISEDRYLLSGLIECGHCKMKMNGKMNKNFSKRLNKENIHYQYLCDGYLKKGICFHHYVPRDEIEQGIKQAIHELTILSSPREIKLVIAKKTNHSTLERESVLTRLRKLDKRMQKQLEAYEDDLISGHDLKLARGRIDEERIKLQEMLDELDAGQAEKVQERVKQNAQRLIGEIMGEDRLKSKHAIRQLIQKIIIVDGENVEITWLPA